MTRFYPAREAAVRRALSPMGRTERRCVPNRAIPSVSCFPGWEGNTMIKWLRRLEISDKPFMTREETSKYTDLLKDGTARQFSFTMEAKSGHHVPVG